MKNIYKLLVLTSLLFVSCDNDLLEPFTPGALTEDVAVRTSGDLQRLVNSAAQQITNREDIIFSSVFTDECGIGFANGGQGITGDYIFYMDTASTSPNAIWSSCYYSLARSNRVIQFAGTLVPVSPADAALISRLKAEALCLRALAHIKIMSYFSTDPKSDSALAGVLADRVITASETPSRASNGDFYALIHSDLSDAIAIYNTLVGTPYTTPAQAPTYYPSKNMARALKARAYALKGDYTNAEIWADNVINATGPDQVVLATPANYGNIFFTENEPANTEVIYRLKRTLQQSSQGTNLGNGYASVTTTISGSPFFEVSRSLFNLLNSNPTDIRRATVVHPTSIIDPNYATSTDYRNTDKLIIGKHRGSGAVGNLNSDHKICRLSEMYFIKAEARVAANDLAGAATAIKTILDKRYPVAQPLPVYGSAQAAWAAILKERRIEFAFEGYRFIDIKRLGALAGVGIDRDPADYSSSSANYPGANPVNLPLTSFKWALPIPLAELAANGSIQQNPGY